MDVERTMEFILNSQAKTEVRLTGITKLMQQDMRLLVKVETSVAQLADSQKDTDARLAELAREMKELAKAQKQTERTIRNLLRGQRNGRNGR